MSSGLWIYDLAAKTRVKLNVAGLPTFLRWSPDGQSILMRIEDRVLVTAIGGATQQLSFPVQTEVTGWSPDSKWLVVESAGVPSIYRIADGLTLPLANVRRTPFPIPGVVFSPVAWGS